MAGPVSKMGFLPLHGDVLRRWPRPTTRRFPAPSPEQEPESPNRTRARIAREQQTGYRRNGGRGLAADVVGG